MKAIKYLFVGALMTLFCAPVMAQDAKADLEAITKVITDNKDNPKAADDQVKEFVKVYKKDANALAGLGRAYLNVKDTIDAQKYAEMAMAKNKHCGEAYILLGDIEAVKNEGGNAAQWYNQATVMDPQNPQGYIKYAHVYAKRNPDLSVQKLEELRKVDPTYPVDSEAGHFFYRADKYDNALEYFGKANLDDLDDARLVEYALSAYFKGDSQKSLEVTKYGTKKYPRSAGLNRLNFYNYTDLKEYDNALVAADALFNNSDSAKFTARDYQYYGYAYIGAEQYDNAIEQFSKALEMNPDLNDVRKQLSDAYIAKEDYVNGLALYDEYLSKVEKPTVSDIDGLAKLYADQASNSEGDEKIEALKNADRVYGDLGEKFPNNLMYASRMRARLNSQLDPETTEGLAKPYYEKYVELILAESPDTPQLLVEPYSYLAYYYLQQDDKENSILYWNKILEIDPENATAKQAVEALQ